MQALTKEPANGWEGIDAALVATGAARDAWDLYLEMAAALYFDDPARGLGFRSLEWDDELRVTPLLESVRETVEPFGLVFFEVAAGQVFRVATEEVTAAFVEDDDELDMEFLTAGRPYSARGAGLLIVTARERTAIELEVQ